MFQAEEGRAADFVPTLPTPDYVSARNLPETEGGKLPDLFRGERTPDCRVRPSISGRSSTHPPQDVSAHSDDCPMIVDYMHKPESGGTVASLFPRGPCGAHYTGLLMRNRPGCRSRLHHKPWSAAGFTAQILDIRPDRTQWPVSGAPDS